MLRKQILLTQNMADDDTLIKKFNHTDAYKLTLNLPYFKVF